MGTKVYCGYIQGTLNHDFEYKKNDQLFLTGYTNVDYVGFVDDMKSTHGFFFFLGLGSVSWGSKKQATLSHSSIEVEYCSTSATICESIWLHHILQGLGVS